MVSAVVPLRDRVIPDQRSLEKLPNRGHNHLDPSGAPVKLYHSFGAIQEDHGLVRACHAKRRGQTLKGIANRRRQLILGIHQAEAPRSPMWLWC